MKRWLLRGIPVILLLALAGFAARRYYEVAQQKKDDGKIKKSERRIVVNVALPERRTISDERSFSGNANAWSSFDVEPKVSGRLVALKFDIGDEVHLGDLVAKIDDAEYRQDLRAAEANLAYGEAKLKEARSVAELKQRDFNRQKQLRGSKAVSESVFEASESGLKAQLATAEMCAADVKRYQAAAANAKIKLDDTEMIAKWSSGSKRRFVGSRYVDEGTLLSVGKPILSIVELERVKVHVQIIERDYRFMHVGQPAEIRADAYPGKVFRGKVIQIDNVLSEKTRNALAVIGIDNPDILLRPGMFVRVTIRLQEHPDAQLIPVNALLSHNGTAGVFLFDRITGTAKFAPVETGLVTGNRVEILSPRLNMPVVTIGNHLLDDGTPVEISQLSREELVKQKYPVAPAEKTKKP